MKEWFKFLLTITQNFQLRTTGRHYISKSQIVRACESNNNWICLFYQLKTVIIRRKKILSIVEQNTRINIEKNETIPNTIKLKKPAWSWREINHKRNDKQAKKISCSPRTVERAKANKNVIGLNQLRSLLTLILEDWLRRMPDS